MMLSLKLSLKTFFLLIFIICNAACAENIDYDQPVVGSPKITFDPDIEEHFKCTDGWVEIGYDIDDSGSVVNVRVVDSSPSGVFDKSALTAFKKLKLILSKKKLSATEDAIYKFTYSGGEECKNQ